MSYMNMIMYSSVLPSYGGGTGKDKKTEIHDRIDADDPANREQVRSILHGH